MKIGFLGLGQMGREIAARLIAAGHQLTVYNRTASASERFRGQARVAVGPAEVLESEIVVTMLADDAAVDDVWRPLELPGGTVHLNMATVSMGLAARLAQRQRRYVAAPVFGRPAAAAKGELDIIAAGPAEALDRCRPVLDALARQVFLLGEQPARANAVKIARNFLLATVIEGLGEAMRLARAAGVPAEDFLRVITSTSLAAPAYRSYGKLMVERAYEPAQFSMVLGLKDVELALATARECGVPLPSAALIRTHLRNAIEQGHGHKDWAALADDLRESD